MHRTGTATRHLVGALALIVAACSNTLTTPTPIATPAPTAAAPATPTLASPVTSGAPAAPATAATVAPPAPTGEPDLGSLVPTVIAGHRLSLQVVTGEQMASSPGMTTQELLGVLTSLGKTPADLTFAYAVDPSRATDLSISALRVRGVSADQYLAAYIPVVEGLPGADVSSDTLAGMAAIRVALPGQAPGFFLSRGDVVFLVAGSDLALVQKAAEELP